MKLGQLKELLKDLPDNAEVFYEYGEGTSDTPGLSYECSGLLVTHHDDGDTWVFIR